MTLPESNGEIAPWPRPMRSWGIDVGQCALKALRCRAGDEPDKIVVEAFDFIEYPKILSQPDADPAELIGDALKQFLSRNSVRGDRVAISVSGQSGLARFIKLPPVEAKKIPDIVRYEARQQIPFDLNDVIWDYQRMGGGSEEEGFALETEIGLFAMKRDAVFRALEPFQAAGIELDFVQLTPLALYNYVVVRSVARSAPAGRIRPGESARVGGGRVAGHRFDRPGGDQRFPRLAAERAAGRQPLHQGLDQGVEAHLRQGRAPEAQRHHGPGPQGDFPGDAAGVQRPVDRAAALVGLFLQYGPQRQDRARSWPWATPSSCRGCAATCRKALATTSSGWIRSAAWMGPR